MALDYIQGLAQVGAMEMSDTGNCPSVRSWTHVIIMNAHFSFLLDTLQWRFWCVRKGSVKKYCIVLLRNADILNHLMPLWYHHILMVATVEQPASYITSIRSVRVSCRWQAPQCVCGTAHPLENAWVDKIDCFVEKYGKQRRLPSRSLIAISQ